jgi:hypothetical protein
MDAHALSSQYELATRGGRDIPQRPSLSFHGDFGAGLRGLNSDAGVRGDFATGTRSPSPVTPAGDFATGQSDGPAAERVRGDFGTGQRANRSNPADHHGQHTHRALPTPA